MPRIITINSWYLIETLINDGIRKWFLKGNRSVILKQQTYWVQYILICFDGRNKKMEVNYSKRKRGGEKKNRKKRRIKNKVTRRKNWIKYLIIHTNYKLKKYMNLQRSLTNSERIQDVASKLINIINGINAFTCKNINGRQGKCFAYFLPYQNHSISFQKQKMKTKKNRSLLFLFHKVTPPICLTNAQL